MVLGVLPDRLLESKSRVSQRQRREQVRKQDMVKIEMGRGPGTDTCQGVRREGKANF